MTHELCHRESDTLMWAEAANLCNTMPNLYTFQIPTQGGRQAEGREGDHLMLMYHHQFDDFKNTFCFSYVLQASYSKYTLFSCCYLHEFYVLVGPRPKLFVMLIRFVGSCRSILKG